MKTPNIRTCAFLLILPLLLAGCTSSPAAEVDHAEKETIVLAIQPTDSVSKIQAQADDLEGFLEEGMLARGVDADVEIIVPMTYVGSVEALRFGHADAALMGSWPAAVASENANAEIVLAEMREVIVDGKETVAPAYYSYYVVMPDSPYETLEDLRGARVAYASASSTSGYIAPVAKLVEEGLIDAADEENAADPTTFFDEVVFAGGYRQAWQALKAGRVDVAVTAGDIPADLFFEVMENTRTIQEQGPLPSHAVVFSDDLKGETREALKGAFLDLKEDKREIMRSLVSGIFVEFNETTTEDHVAPLQEALRLTGFRFQATLR